MRILLVEDDSRVAAALRSALSSRGIAVVWLSTGRTVVRHLADIDVVLLDLGLPDIDGVDVCRAIREAGDCPVIIVSARGGINDRVLGLYAGADDYLVKPYDLNELLARVDAVCRRHRQLPEPDGREQVEVGGVRIDVGRRTVAVDGEDVVLSRKEFQLLVLMARAGGAVCTRNRIVAEVWGRDWPGATRTLDVHMSTLRRKLGRRGLVRTVHGVGYRLDFGHADQEVGSNLRKVSNI